MTAIACIDTAITIYSLSRSALAGIFESTPLSDRLLVAECVPGSDSGTESMVRQGLRAAGIDARQQVRIAGVGRVDFGIVGTRIIVEVDSKRHHDDPAAFERDRWRDAELAARGYHVIRFSYLRVTTDWPWCLRVLRSAIANHR